MFPFPRILLSRPIAREDLLYCALLSCFVPVLPASSLGEAVSSVKALTRCTGGGGGN